LKSDALEPTRAELARLSTRQRIGKLLPVYTACRSSPSR